MSFPRRAVTVCLAVHLLLFQLSAYVNTDQYRNLLACRLRRPLFVGNFSSGSYERRVRSLQLPCK